MAKHSLSGVNDQVAYEWKVSSGSNHGWCMSTLLKTSCLETLWAPSHSERCRCMKVCVSVGLVDTVSVLYPQLNNSNDLIVPVLDEQEPGSVHAGL